MTEAVIARFLHRDTEAMAQSCPVPPPALSQSASILQDRQDWPSPHLALGFLRGSCRHSKIRHFVSPGSQGLGHTGAPGTRPSFQNTVWRIGWWLRMQWSWWHSWARKGVSSLSVRHRLDSLGVRLSHLLTGRQWLPHGSRAGCSVLCCSCLGQTCSQTRMWPDDGTHLSPPSSMTQLEVLQLSSRTLT